MSEKVYLSGELREVDKASVAASNPSFLHGVGLFETLRAYDGGLRLHHYSAGRGLQGGDCKNLTSSGVRDDALPTVGLADADREEVLRIPGERAR